MTKTLFAILFMLIPTTFAQAELENYLTGYTAVQITNYGEMPHSAVVRIRKGREDMAEVACLQRKITKGESLEGVSFVPVRSNVLVDGKPIQQRCPKFVSAQAVTVGTTVSAKVEQPIFFTWVGRYIPRNASIAHTLRAYNLAGYLRFQFAGYEYDYQYYDFEEDAYGYTLYYSWY